VRSPCSGLSAVSRKGRYARLHRKSCRDQFQLLFFESWLGRLWTERKQANPHPAFRCNFHAHLAGESHSALNPPISRAGRSAFICLSFTARRDKYFFNLPAWTRLLP